MDAKDVNPVLVSKLLENIAYTLRTLNTNVVVSNEGIFISEEALHGLSVEIKGNLSDILIPNAGYRRPEEAVRLCAQQDRYATRDAFEAIDSIDTALINLGLDEDIPEEVITPEFLVKAYKFIGSEFLYEGDDVLQDKLHTFLQQEGLRD